MKLKGNAVFSSLLVLLCIVMFIMAAGYNPRARLAPEILSTVLFILALGLFLGENIPFFMRRMVFLQDKGFFTQSAGNKNENEPEDQTQLEADKKHTKPYAESVKLLRLLGWLILFVTVLHYVSYLITVPVWLLLLIKFEGGRKWRDAILAAVGMGIFDWVLFAVLLHATF